MDLCWSSTKKSWKSQAISSVLLLMKKKKYKKAKKKIMNSLIKCFQCWRLFTQYKIEKEQMENMQIKSNILIIKF